MAPKSSKKRAPRPTKLTAECSERIVDAIRSGASRETAARYGGVCKRTLQNWLTWGEAEDASEPYAGFVEAIRKAEATREVEAIAHIHLAARQGDWRAEAWWLEHGPARERHRRADRLEITGPDGGAMKTEVELDLDPKTQKKFHDLVGLVANNR